MLSVGVSVVQGNSGALVIFVIAIIGSLLNWSVRLPPLYALSHMSAPRPYKVIIEAAEFVFNFACHIRI